jgi:predicted metal-dependent hydrolase
MNSSVIFYPEQQLMRRATSWALRLRVNPTRIVIEPLPKKWGSCSTNGIVTFAEDILRRLTRSSRTTSSSSCCTSGTAPTDGVFKAMMTAMVPEWRERERGSRHVTERRSAD